MKWNCISKVFSVLYVPTWNHIWTILMAMLLGRANCRNERYNNEIKKRRTTMLLGFTKHTIQIRINSLLFTCTTKHLIEFNERSEMCHICWPPTVLKSMLCKKVCIRKRQPTSIAWFDRILHEFKLSFINLCIFVFICTLSLALNWIPFQAIAFLTKNKPNSTQIKEDTKRI